jgi:hypothetical protein
MGTSDSGVETIGKMSSDWVLLLWGENMDRFCMMFMVTQMQQ